MNQSRSEKIRLAVGSALTLTACAVLLAATFAHAAEPPLSSVPSLQPQTPPVTATTPDGKKPD